MNKSAILYQRINIPEPFLSHSPAADGLAAQAWGGDIRIGDLTGDDQVDFVVYKSLAGIRPCFIGAFDLVGQPWDMSQMELLVLEGQTGKINHRAKPEVLAQCDGLHRWRVASIQLCSPPVNGGQFFR